MLKAFIAWLKSLFAKQEKPVVEVPVVTDVVDVPVEPVVEPVVEVAPVAEEPTKPEHTFDGYIPDAEDSRDQVFTKKSRKRSVPAVVDLRSKFGPVEQQGRTNACVGHAVTSALEATLGVSDQSRLFVYYNARLLAGQQATDAGCQIRNAAKAVSTNGSCLETLWPYDTTKITVAPSKAAYDAGLPIIPRIKAYQSVTTFAAMKQALLQGYPVVFGFTVPDTFVSVTPTTGILPMWTSTTKWLGGHAVVAVGYDDTDGTILCRNSYGPTWGPMGGYFKMPFGWFDSFTTRVRDAWVFVPM